MSNRKMFEEWYDARPNGRIEPWDVWQAARRIGDGGLDIAEELRTVLRWEQSRMGSLSAGVLRQVISRIEAMGAEHSNNQR